MTANPGFSETGTTWLGYRRGTGPYWRVLLVMFLAGVATFAQLYAPQAVLPEFGDAFGVPITSAALTVSMATFGLAATVFFWSVVADRVGRRRCIAIAVFLATVLSLLVCLAPNFSTVLVLRTLEGASLGGVPAAALAYINEEIHPRDSALASGMYIAGNTIGGISGRIITGPVTELSGSWRIGVFVVAAVSIVCAVLFIVLAPKAQGYVPLGRQHAESVLHDIRGALATVKRHLKSSKLTALYLEAFLLMGGFVTVYNYLGAYITARPYYLPVWIASFAFIAYLAGTVSSPISGRLAERFGRKRIILVGIMGILVGLGVMLVQQLAVIIIGLVIFTASFFAAHSVAAGWAGAAAPVGRAQSTGMYNLAYYLGSSVVGYAAGFFFEKDGWASLVAALVVVYTVSFVLAWVMLPARPPVQAPDSQKP